MEKETYWCDICQKKIKSIKGIHSLELAVSAVKYQSLEVCWKCSSKIRKVALKIIKSKK